MEQPDRNLPHVPDFAYKLNESDIGKLVGCLRLLLRGIVLLILVGFFIALFPFQPWVPAWYLQLGQTGFEYGATSILACLIAILAEFFEPYINRAMGRRRRLLNFTNFAIIVFLLLIPLQVISYGQLWIDSKDQTQVSIGRLTTNLSKLRQGIQSADSVGELNTTIREIKANVSTALNGMALTEQKRQLVAEIDRQQLQLSKQFKQDREQKLTTLFFSTIRGMLGAGILALTLVGCKRLLRP